MNAHAMDSQSAVAILASGDEIVANGRRMEPLALANARTARSGASRRAASAPAESPSAVARSLLGRVLCRLPDNKPYFLQFLSFNDVPEIDVSRAFCVAATERLGRVLQAELLPERLTAGAEGIVPDAVAARLYHRRLGVSPFDLGRDGRLALLKATEAEAQNYEMVVFDTRYADAGFAYSDSASAFSGTILLVRAGMTTLSQIRAAVIAVQQARGLVLGVALLGVPQKPTWLQWLGLQ